MFRPGVTQSNPLLGSSIQNRHPPSFGEGEEIGNGDGVLAIVPVVFQLAICGLHLGNVVA